MGSTWHALKIYKERGKGCGCLKRGCSCREGREILRRLTLKDKGDNCNKAVSSLIHTHTHNAVFSECVTCRFSCLSSLRLWWFSSRLCLSDSMPEFPVFSSYPLWKIPESLDSNHQHTVNALSLSWTMCIACKQICWRQFVSSSCSIFTSVYILFASFLPLSSIHHLSLLVSSFSLIHYWKSSLLCNPLFSVFVILLLITF